MESGSACSGLSAANVAEFPGRLHGGAGPSPGAVFTLGGWIGRSGRGSGASTGASYAPNAPIGDSGPRAVVDSPHARPSLFWTPRHLRGRRGHPPSRGQRFRRRRGGGVHQHGGGAHHGEPRGRGFRARAHLFRRGDPLRLHRQRSGPRAGRAAGRRRTPLLSGGHPLRRRVAGVHHRAGVRGGPGHPQGPGAPPPAPGAASARGGGLRPPSTTPAPGFASPPSCPTPFS